MHTLLPSRSRDISISNANPPQQPKTRFLLTPPSDKQFSFLRPRTDHNSETNIHTYPSLRAATDSPFLSYHLTRRGKINIIRSTSNHGPRIPQEEARRQQWESCEAVRFIHLPIYLSICLFLGIGGKGGKSVDYFHIRDKKRGGVLSSDQLS